MLPVHNKLELQKKENWRRSPQTCLCMCVLQFTLSVRVHFPSQSNFTTMIICFLEALTDICLLLRLTKQDRDLQLNNSQKS